MPSNPESLSSIHSLSVPLSVKNQTKAKFDALLKTRAQKRSTSREQLLDDLESTTASSENLLDRDDQNEPPELSNNSYILDKFLDRDAKSLESVKPPVPKPRTKKNISPAASQLTFVKEDESLPSNKTYNVEEIGDVLVDNNVLKPKIVKKVELRESEATSSGNEEGSIKIVNEKSREEDVVGEKTSYSYNQIVEVTVHKTDRLQLSSVVVHPMVKIHIVDASTGKYFPKSDKARSVVFFYENDDNDYISPVMTHACNLQEKRILYPSWEETILINEDYEYFKTESSHIVLFFEVVDFLSCGPQQPNEKNNGWHNIAFAFLKLSGKNNALNTGRKVRLQLYYPHQNKKPSGHTCYPWIWWKKKKLTKYPSTLYVTIKPTVSPTKIAETFRSQAPMQQEMSSRVRLDEDRPDSATLSSEITDKKLRESDSGTQTNWLRRANEICKLPNKCLVEFSGKDQGCFVVKFSRNGLYMACAVQIDNLSYIVIYSVLALREVTRYSCHQGLIYSIKWSPDDSLLISASADNTVSVFHTPSSLLLQVLPHPSFVYACDINRENIVATGCFDGTIRIWLQAGSGRKIDFHLFQEIEGHSGYVTSLCFTRDSGMFSADSNGAIIEWRKEGNDWMLKREITLLDLKETIINQILLFPKERKLLVHSRDSVIRIIDVKSGCVLHWLRGGLNKRFQIFSTISPCGTFVYSGSENGTVRVWNSKNGRDVAAYFPFDKSDKFLTVHCVEFHPHDNILAVSHYGKSLPVLLYGHDRSLHQPAVDMVIKEENRLEPLKNESGFKKYFSTSCGNGGGEKLDFKRVLEKMDAVLMLQKDQ